MEIGIIGGGATGLLLAHYFGKRHQVSLYVRRKNQQMAIDRNGIDLKGADSPTQVRVRMVEEGVDNHPLLIVCVKQHHIDYLMPLLKKVSNATAILFLQNGMLHIEKARELSAHVIVGVIEHGALTTSDHTVSHTGKGAIRIASLKGNMDLDSLIARIHQKNFPVIKEPDYYQMLAKKLVINAVVNPLTALFEVRNGQLLKNPFLLSLARELCKEATCVLSLEEAGEWENVERVAHATRNNYSSMYKDLASGQPTEIEAITGYLLKKSPENLPGHFFVYQAIKAKEFERRKEGGYE